MSNEVDTLRASRRSRYETAVVSLLLCDGSLGKIGKPHEVRARELARKRYFSSQSWSLDCHHSLTAQISSLREAVQHQKQRCYESRRELFRLFCFVFVIVRTKYRSGAAGKSKLRYLKSCCKTFRGKKKKKQIKQDKPVVSVSLCYRSVRSALKTKHSSSVPSWLETSEPQTGVLLTTSWPFWSSVTFP